MEIGLAGELIIKCLDCGAEYRIDIDSLDEETLAYERNMGDEIEHDFYGECQCEDCGNVMRFTIKAFEYPVGALNYCDEENDGCKILESPETVVNYYDSDFDYYEEEGIRQQVSGACANIPYMILIECKKYSARHKVDVQLVRSLLGVQSDRKANKAIHVTSSLFTRDARQFAERQEHLISLVDINDLMDMMRNAR